MRTVIEVILQAGHSALEVALYTLLPIMVVMMVLLRILEVHGVLDRVVRVLTPLVRPFGLPGLAIVAMMQISFVSFVAPITTLALMQDKGEADRRLAATFAAVLAMAPANSAFPLATLGLKTGLVILLSWAGGLVAGAATYWLFGRNLAENSAPTEIQASAGATRPSILAIISVSGRAAIEVVINIIPALLISLAVVFALQRAGAIAFLSDLLGPALGMAGIDRNLILPSLTKYLAGSTALVGVAQHMASQGQLSAESLNAASGFLLHPVDLAGIAIFVSGAKRLGTVLRPALAGAGLGIGLRTIATFLLF